jgi:hypothetical protein
MSTDEIAEWLTSLVNDIRQNCKPTLLAYAFPGAVSIEGSEHLGMGAILVGQNIRK